jgi:Amt family ammonium transporter
MFAVITPALMTGTFVDRLRLEAYLIFITLWLVLIYVPYCHCIWGGGLFTQIPIYDFAGGIVVHTTAGFSTLATALYVL